MRNRQTTIAAICVATLAMAFAVVAPAEVNGAGVNDTTHMTFKHPVRVPGVTLPAGRYVFQLTQSRDAVWIVSEEDGKVFGPYLTLPRHRIESTTKRVVVFDRSLEAGDVPTIRAWFGRHRQQGHEFIYPAGRS